MLEHELCLALSEGDLDRAMIELDRDGNGEIAYEEFLQWYITGIETGESGGALVSAALQRKKLKRNLQHEKDKALHKMKGRLSTVRGKSMIRATSNAQSLSRSIRNLTKSKETIELQNEGWRKDDIDKAMNRCKTKTDMATLREWLDENAVNMR